MGAGDVAGDAESQACAPGVAPAGALKAEEWLENLLDGVGRNPRPPIGDAQRHRLRRVLRRDLDLSPVTQGVVEEVPDAALQRKGSARVRALDRPLQAHPLVVKVYVG